MMELIARRIYLKELHHEYLAPLPPVVRVSEISSSGNNPAFPGKTQKTVAVYRPSGTKNENLFEYELIGLEIRP
jgi:hypothetical protein